MSNIPLSRRVALLGGLSLPLGVVSNSAAQVAPAQRDLSLLVWDRAAANRIWNHPAGPDFVVIDDVPMNFNKINRPAPSIGLSAQQHLDFDNAITAACAYYRSRNMEAPNLPIMEGKFYVFFLDGMGDSSGSTGQARSLAAPLEIPVSVPGTLQSYGLGTTVVPDGTHLMLNIEHFQNPDPDHLWSPYISVAHELVHAIDQYMVEENWETMGKWWSEGNAEAVAQHALRDIGFHPLDVLRRGGRPHAKNVGMRPYDYPLTLKGMPRHRPSWVRDGEPLGDTEVSKAASFYASNATYFTSSFWRYLLKEECPLQGPTRSGARLEGDFELLAPLRAYKPTAADVAKAAENPHMDPGVPVLDRFLRERHPVWRATGLHRAFPAFIAHFVEWPDQVVKSRAGLFAHRKWMDVMFMDGAPLLELTADKEIEIDLDILPLAAKAIRFEVPVHGTDLIYPKITITASVLDSGGQDRAIDNIHIGLRGQCLGNNPSQSGSPGSGRVRRWTSVAARPLKSRSVNDETVLTVINVAAKAVTTRPVKIKLTISLQVANAYGQCSYHPKPVENGDGPPVHLPPSVAPRGPDTVPVLPVERTADGIKFTLIKDADFARIVSDMADGNSPWAIERDTDASPRADADSPSLASVASRLPAGQISPMMLELVLPRVEKDYVGSVTGAMAAAEWSEPRYAQYASLGVSSAVRIETDAVEVRITSSKEGSILGQFVADFDRGSQNEEAIFRGKIEGRFSLGVIHDETQDDEAPEEPAAIMPTDFFIGVARAGMDPDEIAEAIREATAEMASETEGQTGGQSAASFVSPGRIGVYDEECPVPVTREDFEPFFRERFASTPGLSPEQLREVRASFLENWEGTRFMICAWKQGTL